MAEPDQLYREDVLKRHAAQLDAMYQQHKIQLTSLKQQQDAQLDNMKRQHLIELQVIEARKSLDPTAV